MTQTSFSNGRGGLVQSDGTPNCRLRIVNLDSPYRPRVQLIVGDNVLAELGVPGRMTAKRRAELKSEWAGQTEAN